MRTYTLLALACSCISAHAGGPDYWASRAWVEERTRTNQVPSDKRIFVATSPPNHPPQFVAVLRHKHGLGLRDIIDETRFRGTNAVVIVLRSQKGATPVFDTVVRAFDKPKFVVRAQDVIWIGEPGNPR